MAVNFAKVIWGLDNFYFHLDKRKQASDVLRLHERGSQVSGKDSALSNKDKQ